MNDIEPNAAINASETQSLRSIAISLKRIADALERPEVTGGDFVMPKLTPEDLDNAKKFWANQGKYEINK